MTPEPHDASSGPRRIVVVGAGIAGVSAVEAARQADPDARLTLLSDEPDLPYYRLNLTRYLAGEIEADALPLHPAAWYAERRIDLRLGRRAAALAPDAGAVTLDDGQTLPFDRLVLAAGAAPVVPPIAGARLEGVTCLRTRADTERIFDAVEPDLPCVVIGGGLLGLEAAAALRKHGARVTVVEGLAHLMPLQLTRAGAAVLERHIEGLGVDIRTGVMTRQILGDGRCRAAVLEDGARIDARLVVIATGVRPTLDLAKAAGLDTKSGIRVDDRLATSHPSVLAAGDVTEHGGVLYGTWLASRVQGRTAGENAAGGRAAFTGIPPAYLLKVVGVDVFSIGAVEAEGAADRAIEDAADDVYRRFVFRDGRLIGAILLGDTSVMAAVRKAIERGSDFAALLGRSLSADDVARGLIEAA